ncbi:hypothetical protein ACNI3K_04620 [Demequina sp. SO4-13]|uniref:hypothetical protein n=1 Tax=Demequina sp. SO4-13 TaxID=3401027 RepID=UPI003AF6465F
MRRWWLLGGAIALVALIAALTVPLRSDGSVTADATEVASQEGACGQLTSHGRLEVDRTVPLIDLGLLVRVNAALVNPGLDSGATDGCEDVDYVAGGVVLSHPRCDNANEMSESERTMFERARARSGASLVRVCDGAAIAMMVRTLEGDPLETGTYWGPSEELGGRLVMNPGKWCLDTEYWLEVHATDGVEVFAEGFNPEPVGAAWCVDLDAA